MQTLMTLAGLAGPPSACSANANRVDVFAAGPNANVWTWSGVGNWSSPGQLPKNGTIPGEAVCAVSSGTDRIEVFAVESGSKNPVWWRWNGGGWSIGSALSSAPAMAAVGVAAVAASPNDIDVFAVGYDKRPWWWHWNGAAWLPAVSLQADANLPAVRLAAVAPTPGRLDVFGVGANRHLWHWQKIGGGPWALQDLGGDLPAEGVDCVSWGPGRIDVFAASRSGVLQHWWASGGGFSAPEDLGGNLAAGTVAAVSHAPERLDVFGIGVGQQLLRWQWDGQRWSGPDVRGEGLPAGDVSAVVRKPHLLDVFMVGAGNTMRRWPGGGLDNARIGPWVNWPSNHQTASGTPRARPDNLDEVVAIVKDAEARNLKVRAVGSGWSNSDVAISEGCVVETDLLAGVITDVLRDCLNAAGQARRLVHVEAGIKLAALCDLLDKRVLALHTFGGSTGQSLAGALSTCVHGMDIDRGPLPDMVRAIHLVGPGGRQHWIEPASLTITDRAALKSTLGLTDKDIHYDDDWFYSSLVSLGGLGIVYSAIIEVDAQYDLVETRVGLDWNAMKARLKAPSTAVDSPFNGIRGVQVVIDPYPAGNGTRRCYLTTRKEDVATGAYIAHDWATPLMPVAVPALVAGFRAAPSTVPQGVNALTAQQQSTREVRGWARTLIGDAKPPAAKGLTVEAMFDTSTNGYLDFVDAALEIIRAAYYDEHPPLAYLGWISLRFQGVSKAYLAPQYGHARTCSVEFAAVWRTELPGVGWADTPELIRRIENKARELGGIQHWGMNDALTDVDVAKAYPRAESWRRIRWALTTNGTLQTFDNAFTVRCGLTKAPPIKPPRVIELPPH